MAQRVPATLTLGIHMQFDTLLFARHEGIARVALNRPDRLNALNLALITDLKRAAAAIDADPEIRAVVLTGSGRAFCSGADLMGEDFLNDPGHSRGHTIRCGCEIISTPW